MARFGDFQARWILTVFYFSIGLPFGLLTGLFMDPLGVKKMQTASNWTKRPTEEHSLSAARREM
jgi:hypothetical protein